MGKGKEKMEKGRKSERKNERNTEGEGGRK